VFPTPVERVEGLATHPPGREVWVKRDDLSSPVYGGNKVRTLEVLFGQALRAGATRIHSTGAFGSNHATATVLHAPRVGLEPGVILFPQPRSASALENFLVMLAARPVVRVVPHWSFLPFGMAATRLSDRASNVRSSIMVPGGATEDGALGYVSAALELAEQVESGLLPAPSSVVVGVGSTCTSAGLLLGMRVAAELGIGWRRPPRLVSVRVTPWPVTAKSRVVSLARRAAAHFARVTGEPRWSRLGRLGEHLEVDGRWLGRGYGLSTDTGRDAIERWREAAGFELDTTYSAKAVAAVLGRRSDGPLLYWSTKSTAPLPEVSPEDIAWAPPRAQRWVRRHRAL